MFTLLDFNVSLDDEDNPVVILTMGATATAEDIAELTNRLGQEFTVTPK